MPSRTTVCSCLKPIAQNFLVCSFIGPVPSCPETALALCTDVRCPRPVMDTIGIIVTSCEDMAPRGALCTLACTEGYMCKDGPSQATFVCGVNVAAGETSAYLGAANFTCSRLYEKPIARAQTKMGGKRQGRG